MSREWKPGDVGISMGGERFIVSSRGQCFWPGVDESDWSGLSGKPTESDRLLVVIDPEEREAVERLLSLLADALNWGPHNMQRESYREPLAAALREYANPKPPRIDEPTDPAVRVFADGTNWAKVGSWWVSPSVQHAPREWDWLIERDDFAVVDQ